RPAADKEAQKQAANEKEEAGEEAAKAEESPAAPPKPGDPGELLASIDPYVDYLLAKISIETGQPEEGLKIWDELAGNDDYPFVQARAEYSRILWAADHGELSGKELIDRLERLRLAWHGDSLELKVLSMLGNLYADNNDFINAMRIW